MDFAALNDPEAVREQAMTLTALLSSLKDLLIPAPKSIDVSLLLHFEPLKLTLLILF